MEQTIYKKTIVKTIQRNENICLIWPIYAFKKISYLACIEATILALSATQEAIYQNKTEVRGRRYIMIDQWRHPASFVTLLNIWRLRQNVCHFADDIFKFMFMHEPCCILIKTK